MVQPCLTPSQQSATAANTTPLMRDSSITSISTSSRATDSQDLENPSTSPSVATSYTHIDLSPTESGTPQTSSIKASDGCHITTPDVLRESNNALDQSSKDEAERSDNSTAVQQSSVPMRFLLVDDNPLNLALLLRLLHRRFADKLDPARPPIALTDATVALDLLKGTLPLGDAVSIATPQAVLRSVPDHARAVAAANALTNQPSTFTHIMLDIRMPAISGLSLARRIRSLPLSSLNRDAKLLACTTAVRAQEQRFYRFGGFDGLIEKPVREDTLRAFFDHLAEEGLAQSRSASSLLEAIRPSRNSSQLTARSVVGKESMPTRAQDVSEGIGSLILTFSAFRREIDDLAGDKKEAVALPSPASGTNCSKAPSSAATEGSGDFSRARGLVRSVSVGSTPVKHKSFFLALRNTKPVVILPPFSRDRYQQSHSRNSPNQISCDNIKDHVEDELIRSPHYLNKGFFLLQDEESDGAVAGQATGLDKEDAKTELDLRSQRPQCMVRQFHQVSAAPIDIRDLTDVKREVDLDSFQLEGTYFDAANHVIRHEEGSIAQEPKCLSDVGSSEEPDHDSTVATSTSSTSSVTSLSQQTMHSSPSIASPHAGKMPSPGPASHFIYAAPSSPHCGTMVLDLEQELASELEGVASSSVQQPRTDETICASAASDARLQSTPSRLRRSGVEPESSLPLMTAPPSA
ncbi:unnamed protein product [Tilletia laevis]|uniref:Uncharacterized protein n=2 Tax=Tilletia TaxID=13289 RepID=A0A9N8MBW8_9BASI|nr:hypothetical protein CF336_g6230 [Tilletia laevis]KAE8255531.1 hypothetical protein A4X03_0g5546 [Tilletia caries]CAD6891512.1 unnamed protein product [Tilletia caries]CAD6945132.1 unnamed protein product [Tilletia laevis]CAD6966161.1 unnamed protein product [Tilletia laevis]